MSMHNLELIDTVPQETHGGSMRYIIGHTGAHKVKPTIAKWLAREKALGLDKTKTYDKLRKNIEKSRKDLISILTKLKNKEKE